MLPPIPETLYHGTIFQIDRIDVSKGHDNKDFGKGFYMATTKSQAIGMMHKKYREAKTRLGRQDVQKDFSERLYELKVDTEAAKALHVKCFEQADMEWIDFILNCRGGVGLRMTMTW